MFIPKKQVHQFTDIAYKHKFFVAPENPPLKLKRRNIPVFYTRPLKGFVLSRLRRARNGILRRTPKPIRNKITGL